MYHLLIQGNFKLNYMPIFFLLYLIKKCNIWLKNEKKKKKRFSMDMLFTWNKKEDNKNSMGSISIGTHMVFNNLSLFMSMSNLI
jgi:hypothetical protein